MNKTKLKKFAVAARNKLIQDVITHAALIGIKKTGVDNPIEEAKDFMAFNIGQTKPHIIEGNLVTQRNQLVVELNNRTNQSNYKTAFKELIEEVAYTWFNRIIAIRFMEVNDYLPNRLRVLSSGLDNDNVPQMITHLAETNLGFSQIEKKYVQSLKTEGTTKALDELFNILFIKTCNNLNEILPELFEKKNDFTELLYKVSYVDTEGVLYKLLNEIDEEDFNVSGETSTGQVEIIGWLYQYYNDERKNEVINIYKGKVKKEDIPAATQLFTTEWVVKYMVDSSLGRYWMERNPESKLKEKMEFLVIPKGESLPVIDEKISPEDLTVFDPCMGSGHILVYAFDVLMEIYVEEGYSIRSAAQKIVESNLYGLDIDKRAYQLAYFAVMMKARSYDRQFLTKKIEPNLAAIEESNNLDLFKDENVTWDSDMDAIGQYLINVYKDAKELGSLISLNERNYSKFDNYLEQCKLKSTNNIFASGWEKNKLPIYKKLSKQAKLMTKKYTVTCTNPPYMNKFEGRLKDFMNTEFKQYKGDLFAAFIRRNFDYTNYDGYLGFMTPFVWMFIKTYEPLRKYIIDNKSISSLIQMEYSAFEEATVPICSFVLGNSKETIDGTYIQLTDFRGGMKVQEEKTRQILSGKIDNHIFSKTINDFLSLPEFPIAYWASSNMLSSFENIPLGNIATPRQGIATANNAKFLRLWYEVDYNDIGFGYSDTESAKESLRKWFPYNKGGEFRKWYGNFFYVIDWYNDGEEIKQYSKDGKKISSRTQNLSYQFRESLTWSFVSSSYFGVRYSPNGSLFDVGGSSVFPTQENLKYILGLMTSKVCFEFMKLQNPTLNFQVGNVANIPVKIDAAKKETIDDLVETNINISHIDWNSYETSWDFERHPFIDFRDTSGLIKYNFNIWKNIAKERFIKVKQNEVELNMLFSEIYNLSDEIDPEVEDRHVTINIANKLGDIKSFISYAVGCMFGRYSLDKDGLVYAGGEFNSKNYSTFAVDDDNCIPITDDRYFEDDIVTRFVEFVKVSFGESTLEENLKFIADTLSSKGSVRDRIRDYFIKDFYKDHVQRYKKRPIYWMYDSGKQNGFRALIYMHRYTSQTSAIVRVNYLHELQKYYLATAEIIENELAGETSATGRSDGEKRLIRIQKQYDECLVYDEKLGHIANEKIEINLDDGVLENHEKVQKDRNNKEFKILHKIN